MDTSTTPDHTSDSSTLQGGMLVHNVQTCATVDDEVNRQTSNNTENKAEHIMTGDECRYPTTRESPTSEQSAFVTASYEAFEGEFLAEDFIHRVTRKHRETGKETDKDDDDSTFDDVTTIREYEDIDVPQDSENTTQNEETMPQKLPSKVEHRFKNESSLYQQSERAQRPKSAGEGKRKRYNSAQHPTTSSDAEDQIAKQSDDIRTVLNACKKSGMKRYSSTGDLSTTGRMSPATRKRLLPDLVTCKRLSHDDDSWSKSSENLHIPETPEDRQTLEAQFKLLYRENVNLDKAYGELQDKVRSESPMILSGRYISPREIKWQTEKNELQKEIANLQDEIERLQTTKTLDPSQDATGSLSPPSEKTELHLKEKLRVLTEVKDAEISRLTDQVNYWMKRTKPLTNDRSQERIAELEQSEALLRCKVINLEDQLTSSQTQQANLKLQNKDLGDHCKKLEDSLVVIDAEKSLLDDLKQESSNLRNKLALSEKETNALVDKLAKLAEENALLEVKCSDRRKSDSTLQEKLKEFSEENSVLKNECTALSDRCSALEVVKTCLTEQIRCMEDEQGKESCEANEKIKKLNQKIRSLQEEMSDLTEYKEKYESEQELNANMTEKLTKRISDLQDHIETLKSQLDNQKHKVASFDLLQDQLEIAISEKCSLEAACKRHCAEKEKLEAKLSDQQGQLSDSFERANMQLMVETNEMATRQRTLLAELQTLKIESSVRGVKARIGANLKDRLKSVVDSCVDTLRSIQSSKPKNDQRGVSPVPTLALGDLAATPRVPQLAGLEVDLDIAQLSDRQLDEAISDYMDCADGLTLDELFGLQGDTPRGKDLDGLEDLKRDAGESHVIAETLICSTKILTHLWSREIENQRKLAEQENEIMELRESLPHETSGSKESPTNGPSTITLQDLQEKNETLLLVVRELEDKENKLKCDFENQQSDLVLSKQVEEELKTQLSEAQGVCDQLVARMQKVQEEKAELIMSQQQTSPGVDRAELDSLRESLQQVQMENSTFREKLREVKTKSEKELSERIDEIEELRRKLQEAQKSEADIRKNLDDTQLAGEELIKRVQVIDEEKFNLIEKSKTETNRLNEALKSQAEVLQRADEENKCLEEANLNLRNDFENLQQSNENQMEMLLAKDAMIADLQHSNGEAEKEIAQLRSRIEDMQNEMESMRTNAEELQEALNESIERAERNESNCERLQNDIDQSAKAFVLYQHQTEDTKCTLENEIERLTNERLLQGEKSVAKPTEKETELFVQHQDRHDKQDSSLEQDLEANARLITELKESLTSAENRVESVCEELNNKLTQFAELQTDLEINVNKLKQVENENQSLNRIIEKLRSQSTQDEESTFQEQNVQLKQLQDDYSKAQNTIIEKDKHLQAKEKENMLLQQEVDNQRNKLPPQSVPRDMAIQCAITHDASADKLSTSDYQSNAFTGAVERTPEQCSKVEGEYDEREQQLSIAVGPENSAIVPRASSSVAQASDISGSNKTMDNLIEFDSDIEAVGETDSRLVSSASDGPGLTSGGNVSATESNQLLLPTAEPLSTLDSVAENLPYQEEDCVERLRDENERLAAMLRVAQDNVAGKDALQEQIREYQGMVNELRTKLSEAESHAQSGTESDPEAILQERKTRQAEDRREIERLMAQLQDSDCTVIACKSKLTHEENLNTDLRVSNQKLRDELNDFKQKLKLPDHPVIENVLKQLRQERLTKSSPASLAAQQKAAESTPLGSLSEWETVPFDKVLTYLCDDYAEGKEEIERLASELEDSRDLLNSLKRRNHELEQEALDLEEKLHETNRNLADKEDQTIELQKLLTMNEANSKESIRSKEEDIEKLEDRIQSLNFDVDEKVQHVRRLEEKKEAVTLEYDAKFSKMEGKLHTLTLELDRQVEEKEELAKGAKQLERENSEVKLLLNEKDEMLKTIRSGMQEQEEELRDSLKSLQNKFDEKCESETKLNETLRFRQVEIDELVQSKSDLEQTANQFKSTLNLNEQNIASLGSELSDREGKIEALSARLDELAETEGALRSTMESADDIIAEREQQHLQEVEQLKDGLNKSMTEARRAEMSSEELHEEILLLEKKNETLEKEIEELRKDENVFATDMETMEMERELMNTSLINAREETQEVRDKNDDLAHTVEDLNETIELMQATIDELNNQVLTLRNECDQLTSEVQQREMEIADLMAENKTMSQQLSQRRLSKEDDGGSSVEKVVEATKLERNKQLEEEISLLQDKLVQANKLIQALRIDKENLEQEVTRMQNDSSARGSLQWTDVSDNRYDVSDCDVSQQQSKEEGRTEGEDSPVAIARLQEDSLSLRSENEALRFKIASLEDSLTEMTERPVPKLELGSIAESEPKPRHDDDTGRYVDDCDVDTARVIADAYVTEKLRASENAAAKLLMQVQEMEEETVSLRDRVQELTKQNEDMQSEFFGAIHENFQSQIEELSKANNSMQEEMESKNKQLEEATGQLQQVSGAENQWRIRYQEVQKMAEELRSQLQRAEEDNHELQCRLIDLDQECQKMMRQGNESHVETPDGGEMKPKSCDACVQTLSLDDVIRELKNEKKARKQRHLATNGVVDTENEVSDLDSSHSSGSSPQLVAELLTIPESQGGDTEADGLANDLLLQRSIIREKLAPNEERFNEADIPAPVTQAEKEGGTITPDSEPPSISIATKLGASLGDQIKSLQSEIVGYQLMIEKLKKRNQELLDGAGAAMTQDDKEAMEREISALRGQVALLERNNRIFSDRERTDLKQDLDMANKRCMSLQTQLLTLKKRMEYEEMQKLQKDCDEFKAQAEKLREQLREYEEEQNRSGSESSSNSNQGEKYARLLELEEEAEDLKGKMKEKEEDLKDRDVMVDELQHQLENVTKQHQQEAKKLEKKNKERELEMMEEIRDLEKQVEDCQEMIELKQSNLKNKSNQLEESEYEIEKLQKEIQKKNKEIEKLKWEIESLQRENASLRERIDHLRQALNDVNDMPTSPITSFRSPSNTSMQFRSRSSSRSSTPRTSPQRKSESTYRSTESFESSPGQVRPPSSVDYDSDGKRMRSPLRSGIESAKQKVHDIGDVLDTPRSASTVKSPIHKEPITLWPLTGLHRSTEDIGTDAKPIERENEDESSSSSSSESVSSGNKRPSHLNLSSPMEINDPRHRDLTVPSSNFHFGQDDSTQDVPGLGAKQKNKAAKSIDKFDDNQHPKLDTGLQGQGIPTPGRDILTEGQNLDPMREDLVSVVSVPSNNATLEATDPIGPSRSSTIGEGFISEEIVPPNGSENSRDEELNRNVTKSSSSSASSSSTPWQSRSSITDPQRPQEVQAEIVSTPEMSSGHSETIGGRRRKSPYESKQERTDISEPRNQTNQQSLLPDDRPTLIQEVTKAREEARKWFHEVTQSDREKRNMSRRLAELESELDRLQGIEDNYAALKKKQTEVDKVTRDLEMLRAQTASANRKAEEARERSALLQAHLLDKEEVEAENAKLKENIEVLKHENEEKKPSTPLRELQLSSVETSASELASTPRKPKLVEPSPSGVELAPEDKNQLRSIKDSFEYVANNFTSLVLKKHDAELALAPEKAKVSKLKRKCLERDQLLAKLVLKLRKKKQHDVSDDASDAHDDVSVTSSVGLDHMLAKADSLIRSDVVDSDWSEADSVIPSTLKGEKRKSNEFISPPRPSSALIRSLTEKPSKSPQSPPTHRIFVAKRDYAPSARSDEDSTAPVTHSLLPDLPVLAGDTVVAIGNPDKRGDGKLYQLAEVRGKIGFVPLAHLVAAEQVEGMQAFVQEKSKKKKSPSSSPEKIVDLYRKLEQAHLLVADKIDRASRSSKSSAGSKSFDTSSHETNRATLISSAPKRQENRGDEKRDDDDVCRSASSHSASITGEWLRKPKPRANERGVDRGELPSKRHLERSRRSSGRSSRRSISPVLPIAGDFDVEVRSSTPLLSPEKQSRRSSSLPPRRGDHSENSSKRRHRRDKNVSTERALAPPRVLSSPRSPTFVVIEKTMGQKSMIISWTPPVLDMISRSNGIPVIGYEISIDGERRVQISGAYSNKAILGDLDLVRNFLVEVKTVSSVGTLSRPAEVMYSPNTDFSAHSDLASSFSHRAADVTQSISTPQHSNKNASPNLFGSPIRRATALYDYDPAVDSPYKSHDEEIGLNKGSPVLVLGSPRPDGFCDVQVGKQRGLAPIAFLVSEDDDTDTSSMTSSARQKPRSSRPRTKSKRQL